MAAPVLKPSYEWYPGENYDMTLIRIVDLYDSSLVPSGVTVVSSWAVDVGETGDAMCYELSDSTVILAGNGSGKIVCNADCAEMFSELASLTEICGLGILDTSLVEDMTKMFYGCTTLEKFDVSGFDTDNVNSMANMFCNCQTLTSIDVSGFDTEKVTDMSKMFSGCANLITIYASGLWSTASVSNSNQMFYRTNNIVGGNGTVKNNSYQDATYARIDAADAPGYFTYRQERSAALVIKNGTLRDIADAIREKTGGTDLLTPEQMAEAIRGIWTS